MRSAAYTAATILLALSLVCLLWDLYYPGRALLIFTLARPTALTFGAFALSIQLALGVLLVLANLFHFRFFTGRKKAVLEVLTVPCSLAIMVYTAVFLYSNVGVPLWHTWTLMGLFLFSALSSGVSTVLLIDFFTQNHRHILQAVKPLQACHLVCLACELAFVGLFVVAAWQNPAAAPALDVLTSSTILPLALIGAVGLGIVIPFALELYALLRKEERAIPVSDFICLIGAFCLRWTVIVCGVH